MLDGPFLKADMWLICKFFCLDWIIILITAVTLVTSSDLEWAVLVVGWTYSGHRAVCRRPEMFVLFTSFHLKIPHRSTLFFGQRKSKTPTACNRHTFVCPRWKLRFDMLRRGARHRERIQVGSWVSNFPSGFQVVSVMAAGQMRSLRCQWRAPLRTCVILSAEAFSYTETPKLQSLLLCLEMFSGRARCG